jgi:hypothetical protein
MQNDTQPRISTSRKSRRRVNHKQASKRPITSDVEEPSKHPRTENHILRTLPVDVCLHILSFYEVSFFDPLCSTAEETIQRATRLYFGKFIDKSYGQIDLIFPNVTLSHGDVDNLEGQSTYVDVGICVPRTVRSIFISNTAVSFMLDNLKNLTHLEKVFLEGTHSTYAFKLLGSAPNIKSFSFRNTPEYSGMSMVFGPFGLRRIILPIDISSNIPLFRHLKVLDLVGSGTALTVTVVSQILQETPNLESLFFRLYIKMMGFLALFGTTSETQIFDFSAHSSLKALHIRCDQSNLVDMKPCTTLETFVAIGVNVTEESLQMIFNLPNIKMINIDSENEKFSPDIIHTISQNTTLTRLGVNNERFWREKEIRDAVMNMPKLTYLQADGQFSVDLTNQIYGDLLLTKNTMIGNLKHLLIDGPFIMTPERAETLLTNAPNLTCLSIRRIFVEVGTVEAMQKFGTKLKMLAIGGDSVNDHEIKPLTKMNSLQDLYLYNCSFTSEVANTLIKIPSLRKLEVYSDIGDGLKILLGENHALEELHYNGSECTLDDVKLLKNNTSLTAVTLPIGNTFPASWLTELTRLKTINCEEMIDLPPHNYYPVADNEIDFNDYQADELLDYGITVRDLNKLTDNGYYTIADILRSTSAELKRIRGFGDVKSNKIIAAAWRFAAEKESTLIDSDSDSDEDFDSGEDLL